MLLSCPHAIKCINFRITLPQICDLCKETILGNHLHDLAREFRLCDPCSKKVIQKGTFENLKPHNPLLHEKKPCLRYADCFQKNMYTLFKEKRCVACRGDLKQIHYHDVQTNVRFCLACFTDLVREKK